MRLLSFHRSVPEGGPCTGLFLLGICLSFFARSPSLLAESAGGESNSSVMEEEMERWIEG